MNNLSRWHTCFEGISIKCEDKIVRIKCSGQLKSYLAEPGNGSRKLADYILKYYEISLGKKLNIGLHSLAIEILAHVYAHTFCLAMEKLKGTIPSSLYSEVHQILDGLRRHAEIIDCGERDGDSNRFIWDGLEPFHTIIYSLLKDLA